MQTQIDRAKRCAKAYRSLGFNPLPSLPDKKRPALRTFAEFWDKPIPDKVINTWDSPNIQIMTGSRWRLCVVDCDGPEAKNVWLSMLNDKREASAMTWAARTGGGGMHYYFSLPTWLDTLPSRRLWGLWNTWSGKHHQGEWEPHKEVRLLGDGSLVIAPPSIHVETGQPYKFLDGHSPKEIPMPAGAPDWLLRMPAVEPPSGWPKPAPFRMIAEKAPQRRSKAFMSRESVLDILEDKIAVASRWGLRFACKQPNLNGWCSVHAVGREDKNPSASFHARDGVYWESRDGAKLSLFDLAVELNQFPNWEAAKEALADEFG